MYLVKYGDAYIHNPNINNCVLDSLSLSSDTNSCGYCDFTMHPTHPLYGKLKALDFSNTIVVYENEQVLFSGYISEIEEYLDCTIKCNGDLYCLNYSIVEPYATGIEKERRIKAPATVNGYFQWLIDQHNEQVEEDKRFIIGENQGDDLNKLNYILVESDEYPTTFDELKEKLLDDSDYGGYVKVYWKNGKRYIDYLASLEYESSQTLEFAKNIMDYSLSKDSDIVCSYILPLGCKLSESDYYYNTGYTLVKEGTPFDRDDTYYTRSFDEWKLQALMVDFEQKYQNGDLYFEYDKSRIGYSKKSSSETTPQRIKYTRYDGTVIDWGVRKTYYTRDDEGNYSACTDLDEFEEGTTYYVYNDGYFPTSDYERQKDKKYYRPTFTYDSCDDDLASFKKVPSYYTYSEYDDESNLNVTLNNLGATTYSSEDYELSGDKFISKENEKKFGLIGVKYENSDTTSAEVLLIETIAYMQSILYPAETLEVTALDWSLLDKSLDTPSIGSWVRIISRPYNIDQYYLCSAIDLDLINPESSKWTFGVTKDTLTSIQNQRLKEAKQQYKTYTVETNKQLESVTRQLQKSKSKIGGLQSKLDSLQIQINKLTGGKNDNTR